MLRPITVTAAICLAACLARASLPFETVFKGGPKFAALVAQADAWKSLPIGERTAAVGHALVGTPYKSYTLEIDDRIEAPSANLTGLDCWTFFEIALATGFLTGLFFTETAIVAAAYVLFLGVSFHGPDRWSNNPMEFGFFVDHFTFIAGLLFAAVHGPGRTLTLRWRAT